MVRSLQSISLQVLLKAIVKNTLTDTERVSTSPISFRSVPVLEDGFLENQANRGWEYSATILSGANLVIDLFDLGSLDAGAGAGKDPLGQAFALDEIVCIAIMNESVSVSTTSDSDSDTLPCLEIEPDASAGWTPIGSHTNATGGALQSGGVLCKMQIEETAFVVTDGVSHRIKLTANGGDVDFKIIVIGREG